MQRPPVPTDQDSSEEERVISRRMQGIIAAQKQEWKLAEVTRKAEELGYSLTPTIDYTRELAEQVVGRLVGRVGDAVYQSADFSLTNFPEHAARSFLPAEFISNPPDQHGDKVTWRFEDMPSLEQHISPLLEQHPRVGGTSRALRKESENVIRVVAGLIPPLEISIVKGGGRTRLYLNMLYVIADDTGEIHYPKDSTRREISFADNLVNELRARLLRDVRRMADRKFPLSAGWLRQLGMVEEAAAADAIPVDRKAAQRAKRAAAKAEKDAEAAKKRTGTAASKKMSYGMDKRRRAAARGRQIEIEIEVSSASEVEEVLKVVKTAGAARQWYLCQWKGWKDGYEERRPKGKPGLFGMPGDPLVTWECADNVEHTAASYRWWDQTEKEERERKAAEKMTPRRRQLRKERKRRSHTPTASACH